MQQLASQTFNLIREGGGEQQVLTLGWQFCQNTADIVNKAHIQHTVGFVQYQNFNFGQINSVLMFQIQQTARGGDQNINTTTQFHHLWVNTNATKYHQRTQLQVFAVTLDVFVNLRSQFASRRQNQRAHRATAFNRLLVLTQQLQQWQGETSGFTGTGLCAGH
ncbi:Uncharacterised protein [Yersinia enterocolitica]|nr:Uncharacterised protein [Yersinia enterocolitica]